MIDVLAPMSRSEFDPPWVDLEFEITSARWDSEPSRIVIECEGLADGSRVGFGLELLREGWKHTPDEEQIWFDWGKGALFSTGEASDRLAELLGAMFGQAAARRFISRLDCDVVLLCSDPEKMDCTECMSKFFIGEADDDEGQVFVNFDVPKGRVELREKDPDFRDALLRELTLH